MVLPPVSIRRHRTGAAASPRLGCRLAKEYDTAFRGPVLRPSRCEQRRGLCYLTKRKLRKPRANPLPNSRSSIPRLPAGREGPPASLRCKSDLLFAFGRVRDAIAGSANTIRASQTAPATDFESPDMPSINLAMRARITARPFTSFRPLQPRLERPSAASAFIDSELLAVRLDSDRLCAGSYKLFG